MKISQRVIRSLCLFGLWLGLGLQAHAQTDTVTYVYTDPQGTPLVKADASGNVIARYDYTPYGNAVTSLGSPPDGPGYTGHVNDPETGLVYMQARYYQPTGRFLSPDPMGPEAGNIYSFNRYAYANENPVLNIDPNGRASKVAWLVELTATTVRRLAALTKEEAVIARSQGKNVVAVRRQVARQIEVAANGEKGLLKHAGHELEDGSEGLPHYQNEGVRGHTFWGEASVFLAATADDMDKLQKYADWIPDPAPRPATPEDEERWNEIKQAGIKAYNSIFSSSPSKKTPPTQAPTPPPSTQRPPGPDGPTPLPQLPSF